MRTVPGRTVSDRLDRWLGRLQAATGQTIPASQLYSGDHWRVASELPGIATGQGFNPTLWVISAGYGLIPADRRIRPYSAAFSPGHADCVTPTAHPQGAAHGFSLWWEGLAKRRPNSEGPRTIAGLVRSDPKATFLIIASELYLKAVWGDLMTATTLFRSQSSANLLIISAGTKACDEIPDFFIPIDARLQGMLGGARRSLNTRMARQLLTWMSPGTDLAKLRDRCKKLLRTAKPMQVSHREKSTDGEVSDFICDHLSRDGGESSSALLRTFRSRGRACEQKRFSRLYKLVKERANA